MSTTHREGLEEAVRLSIEYIWKHTVAQEIRIGLHHFETVVIDPKTKEEKTVLKVDEEYKSLLKRFNFKWKQIQQTKTSRVLVLGVNRPDDFKIDEDLQAIVNPLNIKFSSFLKIQKKEVEKNTDPGRIDPSKSFFMTPNPLI